MNRTALHAIIPVLLALSIAVPTAGQEALSPYAGQESRSIASMSETEVEGFLSGEGMELAKPAELRGYPGPRHVLELAGRLALDPDTRADIEEIEDRMRAEARRLGERYVDAEARLDRAFAEGTVDAETLASLVRTSARVLADLREVHLSAHLAVRERLDAETVRRYMLLRGYRDGHDGGHDHEDHSGGAGQNRSDPGPRRPASGRTG